MAMAEPDATDAKGRMGMFLYDPRRLEVMGVVRVTRGAGSRRSGEFKSEKAHTLWLQAATQLAVFARDMAKMRANVDAAHGSEVGRPHAGRVATLSGLLAVAHAAGLKNMGSWLASADGDASGDKMRFGNTTMAYLRATGIF